MHTHWQGSRLPFIDTPGAADFVGHSLTALEAVETAAVVVSAVDSIEPMSARMMQQAAARGLDRLLVVNKIDAPGIDLVEQVVEVDAAFVERDLDDGDIELHAPLEQALRDGHLVTVCFVSACTGAGVRELLDTVHRLLPHPGEGNPPAFLKGEGDSAQPLQDRPDPAAHGLAPVYKVTNDPCVGKLALLRVHQDTLAQGPATACRRWPQAVQGGPCLPAAGQDHFGGAPGAAG